MLDAIKHITDDIFFFQKDSAQVHCVCNTIQLSEIWFSCFRVFPGSAEAQVIWGGIVKRLLIAYFIGNISAKKYKNPFMCVKVIASLAFHTCLFSRFPVLHVGAAFSSLAFSSPAVLTVPCFPVSRFQSPHDKLMSLYSLLTVINPTYRHRALAVQLQFAVRLTNLLCILIVHQ